MIFITVKFKVRPEHTDGWLDLVDEFTQATRNEPGNLWFEWSRSVEDPSEFVLVEAFKDDAAGGPRASPTTSRRASKRCGRRWSRRRRIVNFVVPGEDWSRMGELEI